MGAEKRKPDLSTKVEFELPESGIKVKVKRLTGREMMKIVNNKSLSEHERGMNMLAAKLLVCFPDETEFNPIVYDDLLDYFTDEDLNFIAKKMEGATEEKNA